LADAELRSSGKIMSGKRWVMVWALVPALIIAFSCRLPRAPFHFVDDFGGFRSAKLEKEFGTGVVYNFRANPDSVYKAMREELIRAGWVVDVDKPVNVLILRLGRDTAAFFFTGPDVAGAKDVRCFVLYDHQTWVSEWFKSHLSISR
jgi:hypothetical protein